MKKGNVKKVILVLTSISMLFLNGCGVLAAVVGDEYYKDAYFVTKTGKIKRPYGLKSNEAKEVRQRGPQTNELGNEISYASDGVSGFYNQQFAKSGVNEFDMDLVKSELEIQSGSEPMHLEKMYLCEKSDAPEEIKEFNNTVKNSVPKLEELVGQAISKEVKRENIKAEIVTLKTVGLNNKGKVECRRNVQTLVRVPKQQDLPDFLFLYDFEYFDNDPTKMKQFRGPESMGNSVFVNIEIQSYLQYEAKQQQFDQLQQRIKTILGNDYILRSEIDNAIRNEESQGYLITDGIVLHAAPSKEKYTEKFLQERIKPSAEIVNADRSASSPEKIALSIRPTKESQIVSRENMESIRSQIKAASKEIFGYEIKVSIQSRGAFRVLKSGVKEQVLSADEMYLNGLYEK